MRVILIAFFLCACASARGGDILLLTDAGVFITPIVDGVPQPSVPIEQWWKGDIVDQRGGIPVPPGDALADQVDAWADAENQEYRQLFVNLYKQVLVEVGSGEISIEDVRTWRVNELQKAIWKKTNWLKEIPSGEWTEFKAKVETMVRGMNQRGEWQANGIDTLQSIFKGLSRG